MEQDAARKFQDAGRPEVVYVPKNGSRLPARPTSVHWEVEALVKRLVEWSTEQPAWVADSLRRIAVALDHAVGDDDVASIVAGVKHKVGVGEAVADCAPIAQSHLGSISSEARRTVLAQLGPVEHIDRLAPEQKLRMAPVGITLVYGENGSGKSGYTRIAKRLCRSLSVDQLRGNVFAPDQIGAMRVEVRYRIGEEEVATLEWDPTSPPPAVLRQISVFDSHNARLYVDGENRIAYLPRELAVLEHHGELCQKLGQQFAAEEKTILARLKVPVPAGYTPGSTVTAMLARVDHKAPALPAEQELRDLATLTDGERSEMTSLERELAADAVALAAVRRRGAAVLKRVAEVLGTLDGALSAKAGETLADARRKVEVCSVAAKLSAGDCFASEPLPNVGEDAWRILYEAARAFASGEGVQPLERLPEEPGDLCALCLEPLSESASARLARFNAFVHSDASKRLDDSRELLKKLIAAVDGVVVPASDVVSDSLVAYAELDADRNVIRQDILSAIAHFTARRTALLAGDAAVPPATSVSALVATVVNDRGKLEAEASQLENAATHATVLDQKRARLAELKDRAKLGQDLGVVIQRRKDAADHKTLAGCMAQVATRSVSTQITALRKLLVTDALEQRIQKEIEAFDLSHIPLKVSDASSGGKSLFSVGLKGAAKLKNNQILSEGEQRALALGCFLAEIGGDDAGYGIIVDDPVSSLDHLRVRMVAHRLVAEAAKGRQVIIFTHNIVFFNEIVSEAARIGDAAPIVKSVVRKTQAEGFGVVEENSEPWIADLNFRIDDLRARAKALNEITDFDTDGYRRIAKDFYTDLRESWERAVEEVVLGKTVVRFVPDVMTMRLKDVCVDNEDYRTIFFAMKRVSERSGHDMSAGRDLPAPRPTEMAADLKSLDDFRIAYNTRKKTVAAERTALETPRAAGLI